MNDKTYISTKLYNVLRKYSKKPLDEKCGNDFEIVQVEDSAVGLVCLSCGNRGITKPFIINGHYRTVFTVDKQGLRANVQSEYAQRNLQELIEGKDIYCDYNYEGPGTMIINSNPSFISCTNCGGPVISSEEAVKRCEIIGCAGCIICNQLASYNDVIGMCTDCVTETGLIDGENANMPDQDFRRNCYNNDCRNIFMSDVVYEIKLKDLYNLFKARCE